MTTVFPQQQLGQLLSITSSVERHQQWWGLARVSAFHWPNPAFVCRGKPRWPQVSGELPWICTSVARGNIWPNNSLKTQGCCFFAPPLTVQPQWSQWRCTDCRSRKASVLFCCWRVSDSVYFSVKNCPWLCRASTLDVHLTPTWAGWTHTTRKLRVFQSLVRTDFLFYYCLYSVTFPFFVPFLPIHPSATLCPPVHYSSRVHCL